ncbi:hypothetical protein FKP32DRAFT_1724935 [Trametes sanguinea]|nr:hypothetical protein FKP32DRAFT_1724935 [Trametes sanguinea]
MLLNATEVQHFEIEVFPWLENVKAIRDSNEMLVRQYRDSDGRKGQLPKVDDIFGAGQATFWRLWEQRRYHDLDLLGKLKWWHHHWRSNPDTRFFGYAQWASICKDISPAVPWDDIDTCGTHFANAWCTTRELHRRTLAYSPAFDQDYIGHPIAGLLSTAPFAILARYTQLRSLYLPINVLQRLLVGAIVYFGPVVWYEQQSILKNVEKRTRIAEAIPKRAKILRPTFDEVDDD